MRVSDQSAWGSIWQTGRREVFPGAGSFCGCLREEVSGFVVSDQRGDAFWDSAGAWGTALAGVSGRESADCVFDGIWDSRNRGRACLLFSSGAFLCALCAAVFLLHCADEPEVLGEGIRVKADYRAYLFL